ncbi:MAG: hypothetical protein H0W00_04590, partial [Chloroflexi bacterium]|nr:hypothetical protein [Chloroflexota bacterium]
MTKNRWLIRDPFVSLLLAVAIGSTGCTGVAQPGSPTDPPGDPLTASPAGLSTPSTAPVDVPVEVKDAIETLATSGIGVYQEAGASSPIEEPEDPTSPLRFTRWQAENLARDAKAGGGIGAHEIDELLPMPPESIPFSFVLAGYVAAAQTLGAEHARVLMHDQDIEQPASLLFPTLVLALFVGEVTAAAASGATTETDSLLIAEPAIYPAAAVSLLADPGIGAAEPAVARSTDTKIARAPARLAAAGICGDITAFFTDTLAKVAAAIVAVLPDIPFLKAAISWALTKGLQSGLEVAADLIELIPFIGAIRSAIGVLALAVTVVAALRDWTVSVTAQPTLAHYSVGPSTNRANAIGIVDDGPGDVFSPEVRECASLLSIELAKGGAAGSTATWQVVSGSEHVAPIDSQNTHVDAGRRTTFQLVMTREPEDIHRSSRIANGLVRLRVTVKRQDIEQVRKFIEGAITSSLPPSVYAALTGVFGNPLAKIATLTDLTGQGRLIAEYHLPEEPTLPPGPQPSAPATPDVFCQKYATTIEWADASDDIALRPYLVELLRRLDDMRSVAPSFLLDDM